jgi:hypothetical protein
MGHVELTRERRGAYRILVGKPEGNITWKNEAWMGRQY